MPPEKLQSQPVDLAPGRDHEFEVRCRRQGNWGTLMAQCPAVLVATPDWRKSMPCYGLEIDVFALLGGKMDPAGGSIPFT